jgi:N-acetylneuraminic acid mutarotase
MTKRYHLALLLTFCTVSLAVPACAYQATTISSAGWAEQSPVGESPAPRMDHSMIVEPASGTVILFGGWAENVQDAVNDTWAYDPQADRWSDLHPTGEVPPARGGAAMVWDFKGDKAILFGGWAKDVQAVTNDTWAYDPKANTWTKLHPTGDLPPTRVDCAMAYDESVSKIVLFGGFDSKQTVYADTWVYDPKANTWTNLHPSGKVPSARSNLAMAYDPESRKVVLFGGLVGKGFSSSRVNDTWTYDSKKNEWNLVVPKAAVPHARNSHSMTYDPAFHRVILFGGFGGEGTALNDVWAYDPAGKTWTDLQPAGKPPAGRGEQSMVCDPKSGALILFGGRHISAFGDTWALHLGGDQ